MPREFGILRMKDMLHGMGSRGNWRVAQLDACRGGVIGCLSHCGASTCLSVWTASPFEKNGVGGHPLDRGAPKVLGVEKRCVNFPRE